MLNIATVLFAGPLATRPASFNKNGSAWCYFEVGIEQKRSGKVTAFNQLCAFEARSQHAQDLMREAMAWKPGDLVHVDGRLATSNKGTLFIECREVIRLVDYNDPAADKLYRDQIAFEEKQADG